MPLVLIMLNSLTWEPQSLKLREHHACKMKYYAGLEMNEYQSL